MSEMNVTADVIANSVVVVFDLLAALIDGHNLEVMFSFRWSNISD